MTRQRATVPAPAATDALSFQLVQWTRRAPMLGRPKLPCLSRYHAINLTAGCPNECVYCYAQTYGYHPGWGKVAVYRNGLDMVRRELDAMREKPTMVYFSTASEPFLPVPGVLDQVHAVMELLLDAGSRLLISTKGHVPDRFIDLFAAHPGKAHVQVGITTADDAVRRVLEPRATHVDERLGNLKRLKKAGVAAEARLDPLMPGLTDTDLSLYALFEALARAGATRAVASFLFLRRGIHPPRDLAHGDWSFAEMRRLYTHRIDKYCGGGTIYVPSAEYRRKRFADLRVMASAHGIDISLCQCKSPDITTDCCHPQP